MKHTVESLMYLIRKFVRSDLEPNYSKYEQLVTEALTEVLSEQENIRKANIDCVDHFNQIKADYDELNAKLNSITTEAETNQKWAFLEWRNKAEELQVERDKYQKLLMRWCNDDMDAAQVKQLENETILAIKGTT